MKTGFTSILGETFSFGPTAKEDIEDIFQDSLIVLMRKVKNGDVTVSREGALFSYLVQIGKLRACNFIRKQHTVAIGNLVTISDKR
ncbi:MAG: hypothetical protein ACI4UJ_04525, partial [Candidatus Cryptobacteroides sp.]